MGTLTPNIDQGYRRYANLLLRYHGLLTEGAGETDEAETIENEMTGLWEELDENQRNSLAGLGSDLTWVRRRGAPPPRGRKPDDVLPEDQEALAKAKKNSDWHALLHHLRRCSPKMTILELAQLRAAAWEKAGFPEAARIFLEFALRW